MTTPLQTVLIDLVKEAGRPQAELAAVTRMSAKHVSQMLTGKVQGSLDAWQQLLEAAGVDLRGEELASVHPIGNRTLPGSPS